VDGEPILWVEFKPQVRMDQKQIIRELIELGSTHPQASRIRIYQFLKSFPTDVRHNSKIIREWLAEMAKVRLARTLH
jgi:olefin beta-lactone synthetase